MLTFFQCDYCSGGKKTGRQQALGEQQVQNKLKTQETVEVNGEINKATTSKEGPEMSQEETKADTETIVSSTNSEGQMPENPISSSRAFEFVGGMNSSATESSGNDSDESGPVPMLPKKKQPPRGTGIDPNKSGPVSVLPKKRQPPRDSGTDSDESGPVFVLPRRKQESRGTTHKTDMKAAKQNRGRKKITVDSDEIDEIEEFSLELPDLNTNKPARGKQRKAKQLFESSEESEGLVDDKEETVVKTASKQGVKTHSNDQKKRSTKTGRKPRMVVTAVIDTESDESGSEMETEHKSGRGKRSKKLVTQKPSRKGNLQNDNMEENEEGEMGVTQKPNKRKQQDDVEENEGDEMGLVGDKKDKIQSRKAVGGGAKGKKRVSVKTKKVTGQKKVKNSDPEITDDEMTETNPGKQLTALFCVVDCLSICVFSAHCEIVYFS